ncbi:MAG: EAL domain-containing protein [Actinomycetales bacterium]|nr:EAL domain-containing protein [Actinomycetales bacterium]
MARRSPGSPATDAERQIADLLRTAKESLRLSVAFLSRLDGEAQHLEVVEASGPASLFFRAGVTQKQETTFCQAILDGRLPAVIPDVARNAVARSLPSARIPRIRSYVSVPVRLSDGTLYGTFCAAGLTSDQGLTERDRALMEVLAKAAAVVLEPGIRDRERREVIESRLLPLMRDHRGPVVVYQPIVELATGRRVGAEALSRFPAEWEVPPDVAFAEAHSVGLGPELELLALRRAAEAVDEVTGYVAMNVSPATLVTADCLDLLVGLPLDRVLLELSEHDPVEDYQTLQAALDPLRRAGMRLAIDDVGAGFSSLRHIVQTHPDVIKLDRTIVDGVSDDDVLTTLVRSLVAFAAGAGARVVAEGVETAADAGWLRELGVDHGQGWYFGRPGPLGDLVGGAVLPSAPSPAVSRSGGR